MSYTSMVLNLVLFGLVFCVSVFPVVSEPCDLDTTVEYKPGEYRLDENRNLVDKLRNLTYNQSQYWETGAEGIYRACICQVKACVRKCCPDGEAPIKEGKCAPSSSSKVNLLAFLLGDNPGSQNETVDKHPDQNYHFITGFPNCTEPFCIDPTLKEAYKFSMRSNGNLRMVNIPTQDYNLSTFCVDAVVRDSDGGPDKDKVLAWLCYKPGYSEWPITFARIISIPFLIATILVFIFVPELQNYQGKVMICYAGSLLVWFVVRSSLPLRHMHFGFLQNQSTACLLVASISQYSVLAAFFWVNALCYDIWSTYSGRKALSDVIKDWRGARKKFLICSLYAWGCPFFICLVTALVNWKDRLFPNWLNPRLGVDECFFNNPSARALFFHGPIVILLLVNVFFFGSTTFIHFTETRSDRKSYLQFVKLFVLMGAGWSLKEVLWFHKSKTFYVLNYIISILNNLMGVLVFVLFICDHKHLSLIRKQCRSNQNSAETEEPVLRSSFR